MVLTGGASQLTGLAEAARRILARNVRLGRPLGVSGMPEVAKGPAFATSVGLLIYPQVAEIEQIDASRQAASRDDRNGRLFRPRRAVVQGEFLEAPACGVGRPRRRRPI